MIRRWKKQLAAQGLELEMLRADVLNLTERIAELEQSQRLGEPTVAAEWVLEKLSGVASEQQLTQIMGVESEGLADFRQEGPAPSEAARVQLVADLVQQLDRQMTPAGIVMWFEHPLRRLGGVTPVEMMNRSLPEARTRLMKFLVEGSAQLGL